jgi:hypothetical protein
MSELAEETAPVETEESTPSPETEETDTTSADTSSEPSENEEVTDTSTEADPEKPKAKAAEPKGAEKRIRELVAKQHKAEQDAAYWRGVAEANKGKQEPATKTETNARPTIEQYDNYDEYVEALTDWKVDQALSKSSTKNKEQEAVTTRKQKEAALEEKVLEAAEEDPDLLTIYQDTTFPLSPAMAEVVLESEASVELIRYLVGNRKESARIARLSPILAVKELGKIEDKILNPPKVETKKISQAPEPLSTVKTKGKVSNPTDDEAPLEDFIKSRNRAQYGKRG